MMACVQSATMFGAELWWKGDYATGTQGRAGEIQRLINQEARTTTGCFRTTNLEALSMESGLRAATAQLENRQRRFGLRLLSLPQEDQAREVVGAPTGIGRRLTNALAYGRGKSGGREAPTRTYYVHGRVTARRGGSRLLGGVEEGPNLGGCQGAHGQQPRIL